MNRERRGVPVFPVSGLSTRLLLWTIIFVMIAEVLIFIPSIANFRKTWIETRKNTAEAASLAFVEAPDLMPSHALEINILQAAEAEAIKVKSAGKVFYMAHKPLENPVDMSFSLPEENYLKSVWAAIVLLFSVNDRYFMVNSGLGDRDGSIELVFLERPLREAMHAYAGRIFWVSLFVSVVTASLVYVSLYLLIVRPIQRISDNMTRFSKHPERPENVLVETGRQDEIGIAERRLSELQRELQNTLRQKQHLADLGLAVSKINHDLRNILSSASLFSDRLTALQDPTVQRLAPKLMRAIDRAAEYTHSVMKYGKAVENPPDLQNCRLSEIVGEVAEMLGLDSSSFPQFSETVDKDIMVFADCEHVFRILMNVTRNSAHALSGAPKQDDTNQNRGRAGRISFSASVEGKNVFVRVSDNGPGIPPKLLDDLFSPFAGSASGGTGLGLAIARELANANKGEISVESTGETGTTFLLVLPAGDAGAMANILTD